MNDFVAVKNINMFMGFGSFNNIKMGLKRTRNKAQTITKNKKKIKRKTKNDTLYL